MQSKKTHSARQKRVTLLDVARVAGVSKSTVSRILDERLPKSYSETAQKVREAAISLGYIRDISAASLRRGNTMTIGVIVPRLTDTVMAMLYEEIAQISSESGRIAIVATSKDNLAADRAATDFLIQRGVDGLILSTHRNNDNFSDELAKRNVPYVLALRTDGKSPSAVGDDVLGGYLATRHLLDLGHEHIGLIAGPNYASSSLGRQQGYRMALQEAGLPIREDLIMPSTFSIDSGAEAAEQLLNRYPRPTAIFAINDNSAIGALSTIQRRGLNVPTDISLVGYNDIPIVSRLPVPLTTVRVPFNHIAAAALTLLDSESPSTSKIQVIAPTLIPRRSTASP